MTDKRYYWLKLKKDFFKRHDIRLLEALPEGREYALFYLKLMVESIDHNGELRYNERTPYTEEDLSVICNTPLQIVTEALKALQRKSLIDYKEDGTLVVEKVIEMIGSASNSDGAVRQKRYRERLKNQQGVTECDEGVTGVTTNDNESKSKSKIKSKSKSKSKNNIFIAPTVQDVKAYCIERGNNVDPESFIDFYESKGWMVGKNKMKNWKAAVRTWEKRAREGQSQHKDRNTWIDEVEL